MATQDDFVSSTSVRVYIRPDLEAEIVEMENRYYLSSNQLINGAAGGLMMALAEGWPLRDGDSWHNKVLVMVAVNQYGWYDVIDVVPAVAFAM